MSKTAKDAQEVYPLENLDLNVPNSPPSSASSSQEIILGPDGLPRIVTPGIHETGIEDANDGEQVPSDQASTEEEEKTEKQQRRTSYFGTIMNLLNSLLGAGILGVPNSFINTGIIPSIFLMFLMDALSYIASRMVIVLQEETGAMGFGDIAFRITGKAGSLALSIMSLLFCISATLAYLVLGGDMLVSWFALGGINMNGMWNRAILILVYSIVIPIALTLPRNTRFLAIFSTATVVCITFFNVAMIIESGIILRKDGIAKVSLGRGDITLFSSLAIYGLAFALPVVALPILDKFSDERKKRNNAAFWASVLCFVFVVIPGILGYLMFGANTSSNVLQNFPDDNIFIVVVRGAFFLVVSFAYAGVSQSSLAYWSQIIFGTSDQARLPKLKRAMILLISNGIPLIIAMFLANAKPALAVGGAMGGCMADFFFPALFWIIKSPEKKTSWKNLLCMLFAVFGLVTAVISTYEAVLDAIAAFSSLS